MMLIFQTFEGIIVTMREKKEKLDVEYSDL